MKKPPQFNINEWRAIAYYLSIAHDDYDQSSSAHAAKTIKEIERLQKKVMKRIIYLDGIEGKTNGNGSKV